MSIFDFIIYSIFPNRCPLCGEVITIDETKCELCQKQHRISDETCHACGLELTQCSCKKSDKKTKYNCVVAPYYYADSVRTAVHRFKFNNYRELANAMAKEMSLTVTEKYKDIDFDFVTFVPLTLFKKIRRGYNQSEILAQSIANELNLPCVKAIKKTKATRSQHKINAKQRQQNLLNSISVAIDDSELKGKNVLIVDDVKTTGATLNECSKVLKENGVKGVYAVTFAVSKRGKK